MCVEPGILDAEPQRRRTQAGELLALDLAADPPVRIVALAEAGDGLAGAGKIIELAPADRLLDGILDDLPGAGKPIPGLGESHDPDWWIRRKIESEQLTGLGPPALRLRVENAELDARLDALAGEADVRDALEDFNLRVIEARRQLQGGPPVVTPTRDVDAEVAAWRERRAARIAAQAQAETDAAARRRHPWWRRRGRG